MSNDQALLDLSSKIIDTQTKIFQHFSLFPKISGEAMLSNDDIIKGLKGEKDYYQKQLECLRKELENLKSQPPQPQILTQAASIFDNPMMSCTPQNQEAKRTYHNHSHSGNSSQANGSKPQTQSEQVQVLQKECKELKFDLQQKEEALIMKMETIRNLQDTLDSTKRSYNSESEKLKKELIELREGSILKEEAIQKISKQCEDLMNSKTIEIPLTFKCADQNQQQFKKLKKEQRQLRSKSQNKSALKSRLQFVVEVSEEAESMLDEVDRNQDYSLRMPMSLQNTVTKNKKKGKKLQQNMTQLDGLIDVQDVLCNQIQAAKLAEAILNDLQQEGENKLTKLEQANDKFFKLQDKLQHLQQEKQDYSDKLQAFQKENDFIKTKFATLLDQFQEFVNFSEVKQEEEVTQMKESQETVMMELQGTIKELESLSMNLQQELVQKEDLYNLLKNDFNKIDSKYQDLQKQQQSQDHSKDKQVKVLEEEINYLKKHFEIEIGLMKDENDILKRELQDMQMRRKESLMNRRENLGPFTPNQKYKHNNYCSPDKDYTNYDQQAMTAQKSQDYRGAADQFNNSMLSPFKTTTNQAQNQQQLAQSQHQMSKVSSTNNLQSRQPNNKVKDIIANTQISFDKLKKDIIDKEKIIEDKNKEILRLRIQIEDYAISPKTGINSQELEVVRKNIIRDINIIFGRMKQELIRAKVNLSKENIMSGQYDSNIPVSRSMSEEDFLSELHDKIIDLRELVTLSNEVALLVQYEYERNTPFKCDQQVPSEPQFAALRKTQNIHDSNYQMKRTADNMLRSGQVHQLYDILLQQITKSESLMQDNALLQRTLYKYETTLGELDNVLRENNSNDVVLELKRIAEKQLKEIVLLQKEVEIVKFNNPQQQQNQPSQSRGFYDDKDGNLYQIRQQNEDLKQQLKFLQSYQQENENLLTERKNLLCLCEDLEKQTKESHKSLEESLEKIISLEKDMEFKFKETEEIRIKITQVAELFEKKEIKQKYSFEVLCDFIFDKAKRLFSKYESAVKDSKNSEKQFLIQKQMEQMENENDSLRQIIIENNMIAKDFAIRFSHILGEQLPQQFDNDEGSDNIKYVLNKIESSYSSMKQENNNLKDRLQQLLKQLDIYQNEVSSTKEIEKKRIEQREEQLRKDLDNVKKDKERIVDRNSELALALKEITDDLKLQREENERLRERIAIYERQQAPPQRQQAPPQRQQNFVPPLKLQSDSSNRSTNVLTNDRSVQKKEKKALQEYCELVSDYRKDNGRFIDKVSQYQIQLNNNSHQLSAYGKDSESNNFKALNKERFESTSSYFTDEDDHLGKDFAFEEPEMSNKKMRDHY